MLFCGLLLLLFVVRGEFVVQNMTCPEVSPRELDLKGLDGQWYLAAAAMDQPVGACAKVIFSHKNANSTDVSFSWVANNTEVYYNGSVNLIPDPDTNDTGDLLAVTYTDGVNTTYSFLDINYDHYAVMFSCYRNNNTNSSTYELLKLSRTLHIKEDSEAKIDLAIAKYNLQNTSFVIYNNTDATCKTSGSDHIAPSLVMTSVAALTLFRRFY